ncbi:MAG: hypothetical protein VX278_06755 [Myxococcota bacterium]|nr:hypothetical protein [Myxococcota bacterium]
MILLFISCLSTLTVEKEAQANTWCYLGNKTKYNFLVDTYNGSNKTGGNRALGSNSSPSMAFNKGQKIAGRPNGSHGKTFAGICSQDKMYVVEENGAIFLQ